jgi:2-keto-3-deoxy-L-rhamnonate aldolase RhmA
MTHKTARIAALALAWTTLLLWPATGAAQDRANRLISILESGRPAIGVWTGATAAPRITKILATSDADFIVADIEHEVYDFPTLRRFLLEVPDFSQRYRTAPRPAPVVIVKLAGRAGWDPRYEIAETLKVGPAMGVWIPFTESHADLERAISAVRKAESSALGGLNVPADRRDPWPLNPKGEFVVVAMIESDEGVKHAREIIETPGVTAIQPVHLSEADTALVVKLCRERNVLLATDAGPSDMKARVDEGYRLISVGWDFNLLRDALDGTIKGMRGAIK